MSHDSLSREQLQARLFTAEAELGRLPQRAHAAVQWPAALDAINEGLLILDRDWRVTFVNPAAERLVQTSRAELLGRILWELFPEAASRRFGREYLRAVAENVPVGFEEFYPEPLNAWYQVRAYPSAEGLSILFSDATERKQAEAYREMGREILHLLNEPGDVQNAIQRVLAVLKTRTGFDAVGIRLQDGDDFPYYVQEGFAADFLLTENTLIECGADGAVCRDTGGNLCLDCTCGLVISGKTDPANPMFTRGGSAWLNDSRLLLDLPPSEDPRRRPRNRCIHDGYASVALVPIRNEDRVIGLIQLNDRRSGRFTLERVELLEGIGSNIGTGLMRKRTEEALRERVKERDCLYAIADLIASGVEGSLEAVLKGTVERMPAGWFHVEAACARITLNDQEFTTGNFRHTAWRQAADIILLGRPVGTVEVCYLEEQPRRDEGPFLRDERSLINAIAERLGTEAERRWTKAEMQARDQRHQATVRAAEEQLRRSHDDLDRRVTMRTAELVEANAALRAEVDHRVRAEDTLRKLSRAIEQTSDCVSMTDHRGVIEYVNPAFERLTGFTREEAIGATPSLIKSDQHDRRFYERLWTTILSGEVFHAVFTNRSKDGRVYYQDTTITPLRGSEGTITDFVSTGRDITKSTRTAEALRRLNDRLEQEAGRIASALHDEAGQFLTAAHITLADVAHGLPPSARDRLQDVRRNLDDVEQQLRRLAHELRPRILEDMGLADALKFLADGVARRTGVSISVEASLQTRCKPLVETAMYRLVQEGLTNMSKHAGATRARILLAQDDGNVWCSIADDGVGFDLAAVQARRDEFGLGLLGIQDRLEAVDGTLEIISAPGMGTELRAIIPLET